MARKRFIENSSTYTLRRKHQNTTQGAVFETDLMTITELDGFAPDQKPIYSNGNFKLTVGPTNHDTLKHKSGRWETNDCNDDPEVWTEECVNKEITSASHVKARPNFTSLGDFAYYGSAKELVRATLLDIILKYPGELFLTHDNYGVEDINGDYSLGGDNKYIVKNPFLINVDALFMDEKSPLPKLRYFCESYRDYILIPDNSPEISRIGWQVVRGENTRCPQNGDILATIRLGVFNLYYYYLNGQRILLHDYQYGTAHLRPKGDVRDEFYNSLDDFSYALINRETNRTITLDTPYETPKGIRIKKVNYQWPIEDGWNLDFESPKYKKYVNGLLDLASFYDERYSDHIVRSLTHEALKNFDWTFTKVLNEEEQEMETPNGERVEAILHIYGRNFDDIRKNITMIKNINKVTYDAKNTTPDYFLSDQLQLAGWEVKNPLNIPNKIVSSTIYPTRYYGFTANDANNHFMRMLKLNSKAIMNAKGTKRGLEMLLAMFGLHSEDFYKNIKYVKSGATYSWNDLTDAEKRELYSTSYSLNEYVGVAVDSGLTIGYSTCPDRRVREVNAYKDGYVIPVTNELTLDEIELQGLPVKSVKVVENVNGEDVTLSYLIPWFDKNKTYGSRDFYFQSKGGWNRQNEIAINVDIEEELFEGNLVSDDSFGVYDETANYLHFAMTINSLREAIKPKTGDIYYVKSIADTRNYYGFDTNQTWSHYFILTDENNRDILGTEAGLTGWVNIPKEEILAGETVAAKRIIYLETIIEDNTGNNPHTGKGLYDNGKEYIDNFEHLFKNETFEGTSDYLLSGVTELGFNIVKQKDNVKCWYFTDTLENLPNLYEFERMDEEIISGVTWHCGEYFEDADSVAKISGITVATMDIIGVGHTVSGDTLRETQLEPYNMELGETYDEAAANSILNLKYLDLDFHPNNKIGFSDRDFIKNIIMFYVKQLIPSTSILSCHIPDVSFDVKCPDTALMKNIVSNTYTI